MNSRTKSIAVWAGVMGVFLFVLAACGSSSGGGGGAAKSQLSGTPFKIGLICSCSGSQQANGASKQVAQAWTQWTNSHGGINGHPVQVILRDDAGNAATSAQAARKLVVSDKVIAIAGEASLVDTSWQKYVQAQGVPVVGGISFESTMFSSADFYPSGASILAEIYGFIAQAKKEGLTKLSAFYCAEAPECAQVAPIMKLMGGQIIGGVQVVNTEAIAAAAPSYVAPCLAAKAAGADGLAIYASPDIVSRVQQQCSAQGFKPRYIGINGVLPYSAAATGKFDGAIVAQGNLPLGDTATVGGQEFAAAMAKYAPSTTADPTWNANPAQSWVGLQLFAKAAQAGKLTPASTPAEVSQALYLLKNETLDGLAGPINFTKGKPTLNTCPFIEEIHNKQWVTLNNNQPICLPAAATAVLTKIAAAAAG
jgi:branched-chain amino acid transport system substrate-binding protein